MAASGRTKVFLLTLFFICFICISGNSNPYPLSNVKPFLTKTGSSIFSNKKSNNILNADCSHIDWAVWSSFTGTSSIGTINSENGPVNISMTSNFIFGSTPLIYNHSKFNSYPSPIPNTIVPQTTWSAGPGGTTTMCFSETVTNPVLLIASLGNSSGTSATLNFSLPYVVIYDGGGMEYNNSTTLTGTEGYAIIMFPGDFTCVAINSSTPEFYTNITWGVRPPPFSINIAETAEDCGSVTLTASGGISYSWNGGSSPNSASNTFNASGTYIVTVTNADGCTSSASKTVTVDTPPTAVISGNTSGCGNVSLTAGGGISYLWDGGESPNNASNTFNESGTYTVEVRDANGCSASVSVNVTVLDSEVPEITISASPGSEICSGSSITFTASISNAGVSPSFQWFRNNIPVAAGTIYTTSELEDSDEIVCRLTSNTACSLQTTTMSNTVVVTVNQPPDITFVQDVVFMDGLSVQLDPAITGNAASYLWTPAEGLTDPAVKNPIAAPSQTTNYQLTVISSEGCETSANVRVVVNNNVIIIPNTFTPNGDGVNDTWNILYLSDYPESYINIYNRYGRKLFYSTGYDNPWDGTFNGKPVPAGVYYYTIDFKSQQFMSCTGYVTVLR